jgi:peroxiredoxin Q/BCP
MPGYFYGRGERTQTFDLPVPNRARYQLRHTPKCVYLSDYNVRNQILPEVHQKKIIKLQYTMSMKQPPYQAPDFSLVDTEGMTRTLAECRGNWLVLYFYPKDDTPGCTVEACSLRDARDDITEAGAVVIGISQDDVGSHEAFKAKHSLNFTLLSDPHHKAIDAYGAWGKKMYGNKGILRKTFIIDPNGLVCKVYGRVTPLGHGEQVVRDLRSLQSH